VAVLSIDAGTTGVTALLIDEQSNVLSRGYQEFPQHFPQAGWVEHDLDEIWSATCAATSQVLSATPDKSRIRAVGVTNQRETLAIWSRKTGTSPRRAIVWQDRRTADICQRLSNLGLDEKIAKSTGLRLDPYFTGSKALWLAENEPATWGELASAYNQHSDVVIGTIDSYLISRMSAGQAHVTDATNASRTLLFDLKSGRWSDELLEIFQVPRAALPEIVPSFGKCGQTDSNAFLGLSLPIAGIAGDQQAALVGQAGLNAGDSKCTYGTGSFILTNTGKEIVYSNAGLLTTVALGLPNSSLTYALEGAVFVTGSAVQWLRDGLGLINKASDIEKLAAEVSSSDGVVFVPALTGLGAPHWDAYARGTIVGITRGTTKSHLALATLEAIAFQVRDVVDLMANEAHVASPPKTSPSRTSPKEPPLKVDGGAAANDLLMQIQADILQRDVIRSAVLESTGMGAAYLAGLGVGVWQDFSQVKEAWKSSGTFAPIVNREDDYRFWLEAVNRSKNWARQN